MKREFEPITKLTIIVKHYLLQKRIKIVFTSTRFAQKRRLQLCLISCFNRQNKANTTSSDTHTKYGVYVTYCLLDDAYFTNFSPRTVFRFQQNPQSTLSVTQPPLLTDASRNKHQAYARTWNPNNKSFDNQFLTHPYQVNS